jgi:hypothetical protein
MIARANHRRRDPRQQEKAGFRRIARCDPFGFIQEVRTPPGSTALGTIPAGESRFPWAAGATVLESGARAVRFAPVGASLESRLRVSDGVAAVACGVARPAWCCSRVTPS